MNGMLLSAVRTAEEKLDPDTVSPGIGGFIITAVIALVVILLGYDLVRRVRRSRYREEIRVKLEGELAAREQGLSAARSVENAVMGADEAAVVGADVDAVETPTEPEAGEDR